MPRDPLSRAPYDAKLHGWCTYPVGRFIVLVGSIAGDRKLRFPDGRLIRTSPLCDPRSVREGAIVATANSRYLLVGPRRRLARARAALRP